MDSWLLTDEEIGKLKLPCPVDSWLVQVLEAMKIAITAQDAKTRRKLVEWLESKGIWAIVPFKVGETERTMCSLFDDDWQALRKEVGLE